jgi:hypothetical protein
MPTGTGPLRYVTFTDGSGVVSTAIVTQVNANGTVNLLTLTAPPVAVQNVQLAPAGTVAGSVGARTRVTPIVKADVDKR